METIKIADLTINADQLLEEMQQTKKSIEDLKKRQKELRDSGQTTSQQYIKQEAELKSLNTQYRQQTKTLQQVSGVTDDLNKMLTVEARSLGEAAAQNKELRQARENLNLTTEEGRKALETINKKIDENTDFMKENQDEQIQGKMNVGFYKDSIIEALGATQLHSAATAKLATVQKGYNVVVGKSTGALKLFRIALASTGIGLLVVALGSLVTYLTSTQAGINKVNRVLTPLKEIVATLKGEVQELGEAFFKLLSGDFKGFYNDLKEIGSTIKNDLVEAVERGNEIERIRQNLNKTEANHIKIQGELKREFEEQKLIAEDTTKSIQEREEAAVRALKTQEEMRKLKEERLKQEAELINLQQQANDTSDADRAELQQKLTDIDNAYAEEAKKSNQLQKRLNSIRKEGYTKEKELRDKALQERLTAMDQELAYFQEKNRLEIETEQEKLTYLQEVAEKETAILKEKLDNNLITQQEYNTAKLALDNQIKQQEKVIQDQEIAQLQEFEARKKAMEDQIRINRETDELARQELQAQIEFERKIAELESLKLHEDQKTELMRLATEERELLLQEIRENYQQESLNKFKQHMEQENQIRQQNAQQAAAIQQRLVGMLNGLLGDSLAAQIAGIAIEAATSVASVNIASKAAQAQNLANATAVAPPPLNVPFITMAAGQNAGLAAQATRSTSAILANAALNTISKSLTSFKQNKFEKGGLLKGKSHAQGGIKTLFGELEGGEAVINKKSTAKYGSILSAINMAEGGRPITKSNSPLIDYDLLASKLANAYNNLPNPVVSVEEINRVNNRQVEIVERSRF